MARLGPSPRALLLGDRLLLLRLGSALCLLMLVQPRLGWSCGDQRPSRRFPRALTPSVAAQSFLQVLLGTECHGDACPPTQTPFVTPCPFLLFVPPHPQILTGTGCIGQPVVDGTEASGREWLVWVEGGAGYPESQLVCPSEEAEPRPPPVTWTAGGRERGGETESRTPFPKYPCLRPTLLPRM